MLLPALAALLLVFCVRVFTPEAFEAMAAEGLRGLAGPAGALAAAGAAAAAWQVRRARPRERPAFLAGWAAASLSFALGAASLADAAMVLRDARRTVDYDSIAARARAFVPPGARVLGPQLLWFAFQDRPYRDWDGLSYAHWLTGKTDVTEYARVWRPDYLITDCRFSDVFLRRRTLRQTFSVSLTPVGRIDDGREYCHPLAFYRFHW